MNNIKMLKEINPQVLTEFENISIAAFKLKFELLKINDNRKRANNTIIWHIKHLIVNENVYDKWSKKYVP